MATFGTIPLPYTATTSGRVMDTAEMTLGSTTVEREILVVGDPDTHTALAPVTSSYGLFVDVRTSALNVLSSGPATISGTVTVLSASSGLVQTLTTGPTLLSSAGITQTMPVTSSGVNLYTTAGLIISIAGSSGVFAPVTSSGGLIVTNVGTAGSGSTAINVVGTSGAIAPATSSGGLSVTITNPTAGSGSTAVNLLGTANQVATVTTSGGLLTATAAHKFIQILSTVGAPVVTQITTGVGTLYSVATLTTAAVAHYTQVFNTSPTTVASVASTFIIGLVSAAANTFIQTVQTGGGVLCTGGIWHAGALTLNSTTSLSVQFRTNIEYDV